MPTINQFDFLSQFYWPLNLRSIRYSVGKHNGILSISSYNSSDTCLTVFASIIQISLKAQIYTSILQCIVVQWIFNKLLTFVFGDIPTNHAYKIELKCF